VLQQPVEDIPHTEKVHNQDTVANVKPNQDDTVNVKLETNQDDTSISGFKYKAINTKQKGKKKK